MPSAVTRVARALGERHLHQRAAVALDEHVARACRRASTFCGVHHRVAAAEAAELAGRDRRELPGAQRRVAQLERLCGRLAGRATSVSQASAGGHQQREQRHRHVDVARGRRRRRAPRPSRCRGTAARRPAPPEQQADRQQDRQVLQRAEADQLQHHALRELVGGGALQHAHHLVGQQDDEQHAGHHQPGRSRLRAERNVRGSSPTRPAACPPENRRALGLHLPSLAPVRCAAGAASARNGAEALRIR